MKARLLCFVGVAILIFIFVPQTRITRFVTTEADGRFEFIELPAGRYGVTASKPGLAV